ncbi:MAG TPA: DUF885 domain-containing protein [Pyrinomonadaceae bacterium]|nr:DUF885 domain-containing protein [Pyrinomonadaceae bacterium]
MSLRLLLALSLCASLTCNAVSAPQEEATASRRLKELFAASDEAHLKRNPILALARGDLRYADQFGDYLSDQYFAAEKSAAESDLAALKTIDRDALSADERISYDEFRWQTELSLRGFEPDLLALVVVRPLNQSGLHAEMPDISSGKGIAPFETTADYENNLKRLAGFVLYLDRSIERMREGLKLGVVQPRVVMEEVVTQLDDIIARGVETSPYYGPVLKFPAGVSSNDRARLKAEYGAFIRDKLLPAHVRLRDFVKTEYLPKSRAEVGISAMPGGARLYRHLIEAGTTTRDVTPDQIHQLGLSEVARIRGEIEKVKERVGFKGTLAQFFEFMRASPQFRPASARALRDGYLAIQKKVSARIPALFSHVPKATLDVRPVPAYSEKTASNAYYVEGPPDGSRPGVFYFNTHDLASRPTYRMEDLFLHEAVPGHHFQIILAQENTALPSFQRFGGNPAFNEGWALYAETLGPELGMFTDAYQLYGHLESELWRALRLVVDTGLHAKGWTQQRAVRYMLDNSARSRAYVAGEVKWYVADPGAALAYKIGQLKIRELRTKAERALGAKFDLREFHAQVLTTGSLPLAVLETKIESWIARTKGRDFN